MKKLVLYVWFLFIIDGMKNNMFFFFNAYEIIIYMTNNIADNGRDRMVVGFTAICTINAYHH
jgi:hypothetical protein